MITSIAISLNFLLLKSYIFTGKEHLPKGSKILGQATADKRYDLLRGCGCDGSCSNYLHGYGQVRLRYLA